MKKAAAEFPGTGKLISPQSRVLSGNKHLHIIQLRIPGAVEYLKSPDSASVNRAIQVGTFHPAIIARAGEDRCGDKTASQKILAVGVVKGTDGDLVAVAPIAAQPKRGEADRLVKNKHLGNAILILIRAEVVAPPDAGSMVRTAIIDSNVRVTYF
jgi:hypothetical protein